MSGEWTLYVDSRPNDFDDEAAVLRHIQKLLMEALRDKGYHDMTVRDPKGRRYEIQLDVKLDPVRS